MAWKLESEATIPMLTNGDYGLVLGDDDLANLQEASTLGDLQRLLLEAAGRQRNPARGREALRNALASGATSTRDQLREIRGALSPHPLLNVRALSTGALRKMHEGVRDTLATDDALPAGRKVYGVREYGDWRVCADLLEGELDARGVACDPVDW